MLFTFIILAWGLNWTAMKVGLKFVSPLNFAMQRFFFASITLLPALPLKINSFPRDVKTWRRLFLISLINAACITFLNIGLMYESSGLSSLLIYTQPLFVFCLAILFLNEQASMVKALGVILGFSGIAILYAERISLAMSFLNPILFLVFGAFLWAVTIIYYKKFLSHVDPVLANIVQFILGFIFIFAVTLTFERPTITFNYPPQYLLSLFYASTLGSAMASTVWLVLIREEETIIVSSSSLIIPVIASIFGWVFLGEVIKLISLLSFILILLGIYLVNRTAAHAKSLHKL
jgi:drug/metabolite transporter (DMT)-like permease